MSDSNGIVFIEADTFSRVAMQCEAGLFDQSFVCVSTNVERYVSGGTNVWLCSDHAHVIDIEPVALTEQA